MNEILKKPRAIIFMLFLNDQIAWPSSTYLAQLTGDKVKAKKIESDKFRI